MKKFVLLLSMLLLVACSQEPLTTEPEVNGGATASAIEASGGASQWDEWTEWTDWVWYAPCLGEEYNFSGTLYIRMHWVTRPDGSERAELLLQFMDDVTLRGMTSGSVWVPVQGEDSHEGIHVLESPGYEDFMALNERFTFVNQSTGAVLRLSANVHFVYNAQGELVVGMATDACDLRMRR